MSSKPPLHALTGLRFLAAVPVVFFHYADVPLKGAPDWLRNISNSGLRGVDLFFILSGFVLAYNYLDGRPLARRAFWVARFARIYPAHILGMVLIAPFIIYAQLAVQPVPVALGNLLKEGALQLALLQSWIPDLVFIWNNPSWSLGVEMFFYALFPLLALVVGRMGRRALLIGLVVITVVALIRPNAYILNPSQSLFPIVYANPLLRLPEFVIGLLLGRLFLIGGRLPGRAGGLVAGAAGVGLLLLLGGDVPLLATVLAPLGVALAGNSGPLLYETLLLVLLALLIYGLAHGRGLFARGLALPGMLVLGEASYALYILQMPVASWFKGLTERRMDPMLLPNVAFFSELLPFLIYLVILIAVSVISLRVVEMPARRAIRRAILGRVAPVAAVLAVPGAGVEG